MRGKAADERRGFLGEDPSDGEGDIRPQAVQLGHGVRMTHSQPGPLEQCEDRRHTEAGMIALLRRSARRYCDADTAPAPAWSEGGHEVSMYRRSSVNNCPAIGPGRPLPIT